MLLGKGQPCCAWPTTLVPGFASARSWPPPSPTRCSPGSDKIAIIVYGVAADLDLRIGRDLAVVGFDGSVGAALLQPPLTSVVKPVEDVAERIVARVGRLIEHGWDDAPGEILSTWLREGVGPGVPAPPSPAEKYLTAIRTRSGAAGNDPPRNAGMLKGRRLLAEGGIVRNRDPSAHGQSAHMRLRDSIRHLPHAATVEASSLVLPCPPPNAHTKFYSQPDE